MKKIKVLISQKEIEKRVKTIANKINKDYKNKNLTVVTVLTGAIIFACDLVRNLNLDLSLDFLRVQSYTGTKSTDKLKVLSSLKNDVVGKDVLIVEDICDTGKTLACIKKMFLKQKAKSVKYCVLINKKIKKKRVINIDYLGFNIEDKFIVGYGLDYNERYRHLPYIGILTQEDIYERK